MWVVAKSAIIGSFLTLYSQIEVQQMSTAAQDTSTSNSNSSVSSKPSSGSSTAIAIGVSIGLVVLIALGILAYIYGYRRYRKKVVDVEDHRRETVVGLGHMASHVTPFYPFRGEGPRFGELQLLEDMIGTFDHYPS